MTDKKTTIPWADEEVWFQAVLSITKTISVISADFSLRLEVEAMQALVQHIVDGYAEIETVLERVCIASCTTCTDVCCTRATVWYDVKDLLVIYLNTGALPKAQIYRRSDHSCCNLTPSGCRLPRSERPFICTWYICPEQNTLLKEYFGGDDGIDIFHCINGIKKARKDLEQVYIDVI
ncbi:MAG: hypothetical protein QNK29_04460 [Desulfobacterales bacterium]|nr:hypothetical protein [Desulfobacterales bacterium]